jgi:polyisoprenoid-binding protein YceI
MRILLSVFVLVSLTMLSAQSIDLDQSTLEWTGKKITGEHTGNISIQEANFQYEDGKLISGVIVINMQSITCTDLEGEKAQNLVGHLMSDDFFDAEGFPEAELTFNDVRNVEGDSYLLKGELAIKGNIEPIEFYANLSDSEANATIKIDRTKFDIRYGSASFFDTLGDKAIADLFEIKAHLVYQ